ncbi:hypothetical protein COO60DRAFT_1587796 [Scenedesmus sp. NREL 46B-D3]|nr:hypothetical protein COO60DRAFT_1587796 [Scenedesmus sp. NREL 46B-D3]
MQAMQAWLQLGAMVLAQSYTYASLLWQHAVASWPAWTASSQYDVEYVVEYAVGVLPAWLLMVQAALQAAHEETGAAAAMRQLVSSVSSTATDVGANIRRLRQAAAGTCQLASNRLAQAPAFQQLASNLASWESSGAAAAVARGLTDTMAALTAGSVVSSAADGRGSPGSARGGKQFGSNADVAGLHSRSSSSSSSSNPSMDGRLQVVGWLRRGMQAANLGAVSSMLHALCAIVSLLPVFVALSGVP